MKRQVYKKETGYVYSQWMRTASVILIVVPFILMEDTLWLAAILALMGLIAFDATTGVQVDLEFRKVRTYTNVFGLHFGLWSSVNADNTLLITFLYHKGERKPKALPDNPLSLRDMEFYVHLASAERVSQKEIYKCFEEQEAIDFAMFVAENMDVEVYDYYQNEQRRLRAKGDPPRVIVD